MTTTEQGTGRSRRPSRAAVALTVAALLVVGGALWATRTVAEVRWAEANPMSRALEDSRERLHEQIGAVRYEDPDSTGRAAVQALTDQTDRPFRFVAVDEDGATTAEVLLTGSVTTGPFSGHTERTSVCLAVTVTPRSFWGGRGTVTSEPMPCTTSSPSGTEMPPGTEVAPPVEPLDRHRTSVRRPAPTPKPEERPDYPICYSGTDCEDNGYGG